MVLLSIISRTQAAPRPLVFHLFSKRPPRDYGYGYRFTHPTVLMESVPTISCTLYVIPMRVAVVSPHWMPDSDWRKNRTRSTSPSKSISLSRQISFLVVVLSGPNCTERGSTVAASKSAVVRIATGIGFLEFGSITNLFMWYTVRDNWHYCGG
jgi:hypothetical protein